MRKRASCGALIADALSRLWLMQLLPLASRFLWLTSELGRNGKALTDILLTSFGHRPVWSCGAFPRFSHGTWRTPVPCLARPASSKTWRRLRTRLQ
jgi:hypothetical protein